MIGTKVVCIKGQDLNSMNPEPILEIDKIFTIRDVSWSIDKSRKYYVAVSDKGETTGWISANYFIPLSEIREEKLNQIL
jgi:hypothetical protein